MFEFKKETHQYFMNGLLVPSVTQLLPRKQFYLPPDQLEYYRREGEEQHELIAMYFQTVYPNRYEGKNRMLMALDRFIEKDEYKMGKLLACEKPMFSNEHLFAGTPDAVFENCIPDFKRSRIKKSDMALQIAGYQVLAWENELLDKIPYWLMMWYDDLRDEFKSSLVYRPDAIGVFLLHVTKYYADQKINEYHARSNNGN